jgi:hypothetical protein
VNLTGSVRREAFEGLEIEHAGSDVESRPVLSSREPPPGGRSAEPTRGAPPGPSPTLLSNVVPDFTDPLVRTVIGSDTPHDCEAAYLKASPRTLVELAAYLGSEHCRTHREQRGQLHQMLSGGGSFELSDETFHACMRAYTRAYTERDLGAHLRIGKDFLARWIGEFIELPKKDETHEPTT